MNFEWSLLSLFTEASLLVQMVMVVLLIISIVSWSLIFQRGWALSQTRRAFDRFEQQFKCSGDMGRLFKHLSQKAHRVSSMELILRAGLREYLRFSKQKGVPVPVILEGVQGAMEVELTRQEQHLGAHLPFLATVGSLSVYIGLFGTVWGIMTAFQALGQVQQATLAMVAPGISEALVATALGLFAAIPAVFAYNRYSHRVHDLLLSFETLSQEFSGNLHRQLHIENAQEHHEIQS